MKDALPAQSEAAFRLPRMPVTVKLLVLVIVVAATNTVLMDPLPQLLARRQWVTLIPLAIIWAATLGAVAYAAMDQRGWVRAGWALVISFSTVTSMAYSIISQTQLNLLDVVTLWTSRQEADRAVMQYEKAIICAVLAFAAMTLLIWWPTRPLGITGTRLWRNFHLFPLVPLALVAAAYYHRDGAPFIPMPSQFNTAALVVLMAEKIETNPTPQRQPVMWKPTGTRPSRNIVLIMDESIRADYIDLTPGNRFTPRFAALAPQFIDFGPASSAGDCSNYSNALVRFGASRKNLIESADSNATLFAYAKAAGYRTVYIDAAARHLLNGNNLQNFMTLKEKAEIDGFYAVRDPDSAHSDYALADIIAAELKSDQPVFIYANKNGAHFPYDRDYPDSEIRFRPILNEEGDTVSARIGSYRNAIAWSVDKWMDYLFTNADLSQATLVYTGDHSQRFVPGGLTHCQTDNVDPRIGIVPLLVYAPPGKLHDQFAAAAPLSRGHASHFQIAPTLYQLMGYDPADIAKSYDESLFTGTTRETAFTSGDIFGLFSPQVHMTPVDLKANWLEDAKLTQVP